MVIKCFGDMVNLQNNYPSPQQDTVDFFPQDLGSSQWPHKILTSRVVPTPPGYGVVGLTRSSRVRRRLRALKNSLAISLGRLAKAPRFFNQRCASWLQFYGKGFMNLTQQKQIEIAAEEEHLFL